MQDAYASQIVSALRDGGHGRGCKASGSAQQSAAGSGNFAFCPFFQLKVFLMIYAGTVQYGFHYIEGNQVSILRDNRHVPILH